MHTGTLKKMALALTFWLALHTSPLKAQIFSNDLPLQAVTIGTNPVDFEFRSDGTLIAKGNFGVGSLESGDQGDGTRMLWFPSLGAFRAGTVSSGLAIGDGPWDAGQIGTNSVAFGYNNMARGNNSFVTGENSICYAGDSIAVGDNVSITSSSAQAFGGYTYAGGNLAFVAGAFSSAVAQSSTALGGGTFASGIYSTAIGLNTTASGYGSTSMGGSSTASGDYSTAAGVGTTASSYLSFAIGCDNVGGGSASTWVATDPLFEVGNGSASGYGNPAATGLQDAFVVYKNGNAVIQGTLQVAPGGDIPMYTGE